MNPIHEVISRFAPAGSPSTKGIRPLSRLLGHSNPTTVQGWHERGVIPSPQIAEVLRVARENNIPLTADECLPEPSEAANG